ncbi:MAG: ATP-dependent Clp protease adaptor ClpS [Armatimonadetes bacterium]|nr:ATP-dependent Clp protease adaptor ClpS [Armatimonadota bacterium]
MEALPPPPDWIPSQPMPVPSLPTRPFALPRSRRTTIRAATGTVLDRRPGVGRGQGSELREWGVIVFDNPTNTWDEVILILQKATGCSHEEAYMETWEVHHLGKSLVHHGDNEECERVAAVIRTIGIKVAVEEL